MLRTADQLLSVAQMRAAEQMLIDKGTSAAALMEIAGAGAAEWVWRLSTGRPVTVLCGPGNNGGDGYVIARLLHQRGLALRLIAPKPPTTPEAALARDKYLAAGGEVEEDFGAQDTGTPSGLFVDCLFGSGLNRPLAEPLLAILHHLADSHDLRIAIDLPSGINADSGQWQKALPHYDCTLALGAWKPAHYCAGDPSRMGALRLVDIGVSDQDSGAYVMPRPRLQPPSGDTHKYRRGLLAIIAGEMAGAPLLAAQAAMRSGAGYVKLLSDAALDLVPPSLVVESGALDEALSDSRISAVLIGPGLGRDETSRRKLQRALQCQCPLVVDGDALHLLDRALLDGLDGLDPGQIIVTPHEGELSALCDNFGVPNCQADNLPNGQPNEQAMPKLDRAAKLNEITGMTVLAKGPSTHIHGAGMIAGRKLTTGFFPQGNPWLSVAGSGDVLAGIVASRLAYGETMFEACAQAVWIHSEAARLSKAAFNADDLVSEVGPAMRQFL